MSDNDFDIKKLSAISSVCVAFNLRKASRQITKFYQEKINSSGLLGTQFPLLLAIKLHQPISISELANVLDLDRTTLSRNLKLLEKKEYITINEQNQDNRLRSVSLTEQGLIILDQALPLWQEAQDSIVEKFGEKQWEQMLSSLNNICSLAK